MRLVFISDTHKKHRQVSIPDGDVLVHSGDITSQGELDTVVDFNDWISTLPHKNKIVIAGNHEMGFAGRSIERKRELLSNCDYLENSGITIGHLNFWGSPYQPWFYDWEYNFSQYSEEYKQQALMTWGSVPNDTNILITHGPAYGVLDKVNNPGRREDPHVGCKYLRDRTKTLPNLKVHAFGHIHEGYGIHQFAEFDMSGIPINQHKQFTSVNASSLDDRYVVRNPPIVLDI